MLVKLLNLKPFDLKQTATISGEGWCHGRGRGDDLEDNLGETDSAVREGQEVGNSEQEGSAQTQGFSESGLETGCFSCFHHILMPEDSAGHGEHSGL